MDNLTVASLDALTVFPPAPSKPRQQRLPKYRRTQESRQVFSRRQITERDLEIVVLVLRYHLLPSSLLVRLIPHNEDITYRRLQKLYHLGYLNRFHLPRLGRFPGEFNYYLDNPDTLRLLIEQGMVNPDKADFQLVQRNREKAYADMNRPETAESAQAQALFLKHELMISRFHAMLELGARVSRGGVELVSFQQGPSLWHSVVTPRLRQADLFEAREAASSTEIIPHRPDAFFTLRLAGRPKESQLAHFFYEADRKTTSAPKFNRKLRGHFHYIVLQRRHREQYGVARIRAVLIETLDEPWAKYLRTQAANQIVSEKPSSLFWFTHSTHFTEPVLTGKGKNARPLPMHLARPESIFARLWATPADDRLHSLLEE